MHSSPHSCSMNIKRFLVSPLPSSTLTVPPGTLPSSSPTFRSPWPLKSTGTGLGTSRERSFFGPRDFSWGRFRGFALQQCKSTSSRQAMSSDTRAWCFIFSASVYRMFTMWLWPGNSVTLMHKSDQPLWRLCPRLPQRRCLWHVLTSTVSGCRWSTDSCQVNYMRISWIVNNSIQLSHCQWQ